MGWYPNEIFGQWNKTTHDLLELALDEACAHAEANGLNFSQHGIAARDALAIYLVDIARQGERDQRRLVGRALLRLQRGKKAVLTAVAKVRRSSTSREPGDLGQ